MGAERLQKILAHAGVASRRKAEELIETGHVSVNGKVIRELGSKADIEQDLIQVDGRTIRETQDKVYYVLYKPAACVTTLSDPEDRPTIKTYLEHIPERVYPVGRLDYDVEGALIVTNDGALAFSIMHPRFGVRRTYLAKVHGMPAPGQLERLRAGVRLEDGRARALEAEGHSRTPKNTWVRVVVAEGRPHLVKRLMEAVGAPVQKLHRADYGGIGVAGHNRERRRRPASGDSRSRFPRGGMAMGPLRPVGGPAAAGSAGDGPSTGSNRDSTASQG